MKLSLTPIPAASQAPERCSRAGRGATARERWRSLTRRGGATAKRCERPHGERVGKWHPRLMFYRPFMRREQLGLAAATSGEVMIGEAGRPTAHLVVMLKEWAAK